MNRNLFSLLLLALGMAGGTFAQEKAGPAKPAVVDPWALPEWLDELEGVEPGKVAAIKPCEFELVMSWSNIVTAGVANIVIGDGEHEDFPGMLIGRAEGRSAGLARALYKYDFTMWSAIDPKSLQAVRFLSTEQEKKETVKTDNTRDRKGIVSLTDTVDKDGKAVSDRRSRFPMQSAYDLLGSILYLRSHEFTEKGQKVSVVSHPFGGAYIVHLEYEGREEHKTSYGEYDCLRFKVGVDKIEKKDGKLVRKSYEKFENATLWVSDDEYRLPVEIRARIMVGSIRATLRHRAFLDEEEEKK